jgi:hypothetical protein
MTKMENSLKESVKGAYATVQEDGWKSLSKKHLVAFMYTAKRQAHLTNVYDMTALRKTGLNLLDKMRAEWEALEEMGIQPIGVAGDAAGDGGKMRRLLKAEKPHALIADCWTHQVSKMNALDYQTSQ